MNNSFFAAAFAGGLAALAWVAAGFVGSNGLALAMTAVIAAVYLLGAFELRQFRAAGRGLAAALDGLAHPPAALDDWLARVPAPLRQPVRLRIEDGRGALPAPALTPYLVGLLVMLGMLGTFLGMIVTFRGAVFALEGSTDLQAIRSALAEPIKGLGLSFGTSVAGVAASAMLGLMSALCRRERAALARVLDQRIAGPLQPFSLVHQRQEGYRALQSQARALPEVAERLQALIERMERRGEQLDAQLIERQDRFQREAGEAYRALAQSVGDALQRNVEAGARAAGDAIRPLVQDTMAQVARESGQLHARLDEAARAQVEVLSQQFGAMARGVSEGWTTALREHERTSQAVTAGLGQALDAFTTTFEQRSAALLDSVGENAARLQADLVRQEARQAEAVAGVTAQLRAEMARIAERENLALQERTQLLQRLDGLLAALQATDEAQRAAMASLVASATATLERSGAAFSTAVEAQAGQAAEAAAHVGASAVELASLAEAFERGVQLFQSGSERLLDGLQRVEASLVRSTARSDEQLAYYVAQAREVIDLSIASQQGLVEHLRQLQGKPAKPLALVEGARA